MTRAARRQAFGRIAWGENVVFALTAMRTQKLRSFLTLLGVMAGVATVIMMVSFVVGFNNSIRAGFTSFGAYLVQFQKFEPRFGGPGGPPEEQRNRRDLTLEDAQALKRLSRLAAAVSPERYKFGDVVVRAGDAEANGPVLVGQDTRRSGSMLSAALQAGFHSAGVDTIDVGVMPSGGISYLTARSSATMGAIVSASHNPAADNGIKLLAARGTKLPDAVERELEDRMRARGHQEAIGSAIGFRSESPESYEQYLDHLVGASRYSLNGLQLAVDTANGAAYRVAQDLFDRLKAEVRVFHAEPNGSNINDGCGATSPEFIAKHAGGRIGLAFDGDADRLIAAAAAVHRRHSPHGTFAGHLFRGARRLDAPAEGSAV